MVLQTVSQCVESLQKEFDILGIVDCSTHRPTSIDLYLKFKQLHRESYEGNQRIVVLLTEDYGQPGLMLQSIQTMLNTVDISNFFVYLVTTNKHAVEDYAWVLDNVSLDKTPVHVYVCAGNYNQLSPDGINRFTKIQDVSSTGNLDIIENLTAKQKELLFESKTFCMFPWSHLMINADSRVTPCAENREYIGNCKTNTLKELWNSDQLKQMRVNMINGQPSKGCENCYRKEELGRDTFRKSINRSLAHRINKVDVTQTDGHLEDFSLNYWDIRFNNLCNLACRSCKPEVSSSWHAAGVAIGIVDKSSPAIVIAGRTPDDIFDQILEHINHVDKIYFAGGEPIIIDRCWEILDRLIEKELFDVELNYSTNFTRTDFKGRSIFDLWKKFKKVSVGASLDAEHSRAEYLRHGTDWEKVVNNRKEMLEKCPEVDFYISSTVSIINALHLPDFHRSWIEQGLIRPEQYNLQMLFMPEWMRVDCAPKELKEQIRQRYTEHINWLRPLDPLGRATTGFQSIINYMDNSNTFDSVEFWNNIDPLDNFYKEDLLTVYPELNTLLRP